MKKIALVQPLKYRFDDSFNGSLGLAYISADLRNRGYKTRIFDANNMEGDIADEIVAFEPDGIGITLTSIPGEETAKLVNKLKLENPDAPVMLGGPSFTLLPDYCLEAVTRADFGIRGDGIPAAAVAFDLFFKQKDISSVKGIVYRDGSGIKGNGFSSYDLSAWPNADRSGMRNKTIEGLNFYEIVSSVGCGGRCTFCVTPELRKGISVRPVSNVMEEMKQLPGNARNFHFYDENFLGIEGHLDDICFGMKSKGVDGFISFDARADDILNN